MRVRHHGRETAYAFEDSDLTVVWIHGSGATHSVWKSQMARLNYGYAALDLSGHGDSEDFVDGSEIREYVRDVDSVVRQVDADYVVGNSLGGAVVQRYLLDHDPELTGAVLVGTGAKLAVLDDLLEWLSSDGDFDRAVEFLHGKDRLFHDLDTRYVETSKSVMREVGRRVTERGFKACDRFDVRDTVNEIDIPVLAVGGEYDGLTPPRYHEFLRDEIPDCELELIDDAAHMCMLEKPRKFNRVVESFVTDTQT